MASDNGAHGHETVSADISSQVAFEKSAIRRVAADQVETEKSAIGVASFGRGTIRQSSAGVIIGRSVAVDEVRTGVLIAPVVRGDVHTLLDMRSAVAIGFGMVLGKVFLAGIRAAVRRVTG